MENLDDAKGRIFAPARRRAHAKASNINGDNARDDPARDDPARVRAWHSRCVLNVLPNEGARAGNRINIQQEQRFRGLSGQLFEMGIGRVSVVMVDANEPGILAVGHTQLLLILLLQRRMAKSHVVRNGPQLAEAGDLQEAALPG